MPLEVDDMVVLTPDEINRFISTLKSRYGAAKKRSGVDKSA